MAPRWNARRGVERAWARIRGLSSGQVSAAVGLAALVAGLAYNAHSIREQTRQSRLQGGQIVRQTREAEETRVAAEVALLSQLNQTFNALDQALGETKAEDWLCNPLHGKRSLPPADERVVYRALDYYDWLAWLFNNHRIKYGPAKRYWTDKMLAAERFGDWFFPEEGIARDFPELARLRRDLEPDWEVCPGTDAG